MKLTQVVDAMSGKIAKWLKTLGRPDCVLGVRAAHPEQGVAPGGRAGSDAGARITTVHRAYLIIALFVAIIIFFVVLIQVQMDTLNAIRAYVGGQGLWAKAQKDAVHSLEHYAASHDEASYQAYQRQIQVPLGDRRARIELQKEDPDIAVVLAGFVQGGNHPDDLESAVRFFRRFQLSVYMSHVIGHWTSGDRLIAELNGVAEALHEEIASRRNNPEAIRSFITKLDDIDRQVTLEEDQFSSALGEASRWVKDFSRNLTYAIAFLFIALGVGLSWPIITRIRATENALAEKARTLVHLQRSQEQILNSVGEGIHGIDLEEKVIFENPAALAMLGWSVQEIVGRSSHAVMHHTRADGSPYPPSECHVYATLRDGATRHIEDEVFWRKDGTSFPVAYTCTPMKNEAGEIEGAIISFRNITERKRREQQLKASLAEKEVLVQSLHELAAHDGLTGLYNHRAFYTLLEDELTRAQRFARPASLLLLDIDHFKRVNDTHGHLAGDAILKGLSELLGHQARAIDRVCRYGGEEITVILPESDLEAAANMAERMRAAVEAQPFDVETGASVSITVSIGVASWPAQATSVQTLVAAADAAMYAAKQGGRNRVVCFEPTPGQPS